MKKIVNKNRLRIAIIFCCSAYIGLGGFTSYAACAHEWRNYGWDLGYSYYSATQCAHNYTSWRTCTLCGETELKMNHTTYESHQIVPYSAICNGQNQTIKGTCSNCQHGVTQTKKCPAAPHMNGQCPALPLSVKPEELIK